MPAQTNTCSAEHKAIRNANVPHGGYSVSGTAACLCNRHTLVRRNGLADLQKGERYASTLYWHGNICLSTVVKILYNGLHTDVHAHRHRGLHLPHLRHRVSILQKLRAACGQLPSEYAPRRETYEIDEMGHPQEALASSRGAESLSVLTELSHILRSHIR